MAPPALKRHRLGGGGAVWRGASPFDDRAAPEGYNQKNISACRSFSACPALRVRFKQLLALPLQG
eukprot:7291622-Alexandrium_andersonii.AAC.1